MEQRRLVGRVKFFKEKNGWGFITDEKTDKDYFVHHSDILMKGFKTLKTDEKVEFIPVTTDQHKEKATKVVVIGA